MPLCIYFEMGYDLDRLGVPFVTGVNKVHFFSSIATTEALLITVVVFQAAMHPLPHFLLHLRYLG